MYEDKDDPFLKEPANLTNGEVNTLIDCLRELSGILNIDALYEPFRSLDSMERTEEE